MLGRSGPPHDYPRRLATGISISLTRHPGVFDNVCFRYSDLSSPS